MLYDDALLANVLGCLQGMTITRAVLPWQDGFPTSEMHQFFKGNVFGSIYPISKSKCVWSLVVQDSDTGHDAASSIIAGLPSPSGAAQHASVGNALVPEPGTNSAHEVDTRQAKQSQRLIQDNCSEQPYSYETSSQLPKSMQCVMSQVHDCMHIASQQSSQPTCMCSASWLSCTDSSNTSDWCVQQAKVLWAGGPPVIAAAIAATDPSTVLQHQLHVRHPSSLDGGHWGVGRVTLVGDAAHATRAVSGQPFLLLHFPNPSQMSAD